MPVRWTITFAFVVTTMFTTRIFAQALSAQKSSSKPIYIFCFGDSLTVGSSPPEFNLYPYGPHLEQRLREQHNMPSAVVRWKGLPGWTSAQMVEEIESESAGLAHIVKKAPPLHLAIILAGTNDLAYDSDNVIFQHIWKLHTTCHELGVSQTLAIGIPSSGYQQVAPPAMKKAQSVNAMLKASCEASQKSHYVDFPFGFDRSSDKWAPDGLHLAAPGYQVLGQSLAEPVKQIIECDQLD